MDEEVPDGLRYRKKLKARLAIERAALELVLERNFAEVTVEDICVRADMSRKTFFNYFPSKAAVLAGGMDSPLSKDDIAAALDERANECYLDVLVDVVSTNFASGADVEVNGLRRKALLATPDLFFQGQRDMLVVYHCLTESLQWYLRNNPDRRLLSGRSLDEEVLVAASSIISMARTKSMLHIYGDEELSSGETRRLLASYLLGEDALTD